MYQIDAKFWLQKNMETGKANILSVVNLNNPSWPLRIFVNDMFQ